MIVQKRGPRWGLIFGVLAGVAAIAGAQAIYTANQGKPGRQGPWPVTAQGTGGTIKTDSSGNVQVLTQSMTSCVYGEVAVLASAATAVPASPLSGRTSLLIQNNGPNAIRCATNNSVTTGTGTAIAASGDRLAIDTTDAVTWYCKALTADQTAGATPGTATNYVECKY